jgi:hypothetical protein
MIHLSGDLITELQAMPYYDSKTFQRGSGGQCGLGGMTVL